MHGAALKDDILMTQSKRLPSHYTSLHCHRCRVEFQTLRIITFSQSDVWCPAFLKMIKIKYFGSGLWLAQG